MSAPPEFEIAIPKATIADSVEPGQLRTLAAVAERAGFDAISVGDHVTIPATVPDEYPFTPAGEAPLAVSNAIHDVFLALADLCDATDEIALGSNVCVVPYRHPLVLARNVLTLLSLSDGRFEFGVGAGWLRTEFEALDVPFEERGSRTDEFLELFERICREGQLAFDGPHHSFEEVGFYPQPAAPPKIMVGGHSEAAFERVARFGDGWTILWLRPAALRSAREELLDAWEARSRAGVPEISVVRPVDVDAATDRDRSRPLVGAPGKVVRDVEAYLDAGATRIAITFFEDAVEEQVRQAERFGEAVIAQFG
jgi:probable F420-dependent oxidoreductase